MLSRSLNLVIISIAATAAFAQEKPTAAVAASPAPALSFGGDVRLRYEAYDGVQTLNCNVPFHHRDYFRLRGRFWANQDFGSGVSAYGRLAAEPRYWFNNSTKTGDGKEWKYALIDNLHVKWATELPGKAPLSITAGRQDIQLGDQWLVSDGTPSDGSWTNYFDGVRATLDIASVRTKVDAIVFKQQARPEDQFPIVGRSMAFTVMEQDELGAILYLTNKSVKNLQIEGYGMYKEDKRVTSAGNSGTAYTAGARAVATPSPKWLVSVEAAKQWGRRNLQVRYPTTISGKRDIEAYGANAKLTYSFKDKLNNQLTLQGEYLSGDDPDTADRDEMFDVLWGRYPRIGETWAAAYAMEAGGRSSQFQNLLRCGVVWAVAPLKNTSVSTLYCALFAPEEVPTRSTNNARFSRDGNFRGHQAQVIVKQKITKEFSALLFAEAAFLGDFYAERDTITFVRAEVMYTF